MTVVPVSSAVTQSPWTASTWPGLGLLAPGGLPVAYGICEALQARQVYWAEREAPGKAYRFRPFLEPQPGEQVMLVDDILHSGANLMDLKAAIENNPAINELF